MVSKFFKNKRVQHVCYVLVSAYFIISVFLSSVSAFGKEVSVAPVLKHTIVIDAGHGGFDVK